MLNTVAGISRVHKPLYTYIALGIVMFIFCFHAFTLSKGSAWGDDWAMYVNHAYSLARGKAYMFPGYIFNPMYATYAPTNYPAGYPLLLLPVVAISGIALTPLKLVNILLLVSGLFGLWIWLKPRLHPVSSLILILIVGISPYYWQLRDQLLSDIPFFTVSVAFFLCYDQLYKKPGWKLAVILGLILFFTYAIRAAGLFLMLAVLVHTIIGPASLRRYSALALACSVVFVLIHNSLVYTGSYFTMVVLGVVNKDPFNQLYNGLAPYVTYMGSFLQIRDPNVNSELGFIFTAMMTVLIPVGILTVRRWTLLETYICLHLLVLAFFPGTQGFRYLVCFFPFLLYYAFDVVERLPVRTVRMTFASIMLIMLTLHVKQWYIENYTRIIPVSISDANAQEMFRFIREQTPADAVIIADKPRAVSLYTDRRATVYPDREHENVWLDWLHTAHVTHAVKLAWDEGVSDRYWARYIDAHPTQFTRVFEHTGFQVYQLHPDSIPSR